jgi:hypothetical protein
MTPQNQSGDIISVMVGHYTNRGAGRRELANGSVIIVTCSEEPQ